MTMQSLEQLSTVHLPQAHCLIIAATGKDPPIGAEGYTSLAVQDGEAPTTAYFPQAYRSISVAAG